MHLLQLPCMHTHTPRLKAPIIMRGLLSYLLNIALFGLASSCLHLALFGLHFGSCALTLSVYMQPQGKHKANRQATEIAKTRKANKGANKHVNKQANKKRFPRRTNVGLDWCSWFHYFRVQATHIPSSKVPKRDSRSCV